MTAQGVAVISSATHVAVKQLILPVLVKSGRRGRTAHEMSVRLGHDHGKVSGAMSSLHKQNKVALLAHKRNGQHVYVLDTNVFGRPTRPRQDQKFNAEKARATALAEAVQTAENHRGGSIDDLIESIRALQ